MDDSVNSDMSQRETVYICVCHYKNGQAIIVIQAHFYLFVKALCEIFQIFEVAVLAKNIATELLMQANENGLL